MSTIRKSLAHVVKSVAERRLGVSIARVPRFPHNKHSDHALRSLRSWSERDVFFDVGANDGRTVLRLHEQLGRPRTFAFEPVSSTYRTLVERTAHLPNVRTFPLALGAEQARTEIYLHAVDAMSSFSRGWSDAWQGTEQVEVSTVDAVMREQGIDLIHFLKIDTEGYEMEVLHGAEGALRGGRIAILQLEVGVDQLSKPIVSLETVRRHLAPRGYLLQGIYNQCTTAARPAGDWPARERTNFHAEALGYCDALFIRADSQ